MINQNYEKLSKNYIFTEISSKIKDFKANNNKKLYNLSIGDVSLPINENIISVMQKALSEQKIKNKFKGYPPEIGYDFLKKKIVTYYKQKNVDISTEDVFVSNGAGCDLGNLLDLFEKNKVVIQDPTYPAYFDSSVIKGMETILLGANKENNYLVTPKNLKEESYIVYLCSPNNPTGKTFAHSELKQWVDFCLRTNSIIIYDVAYESFVEGNFVKSIYQIENAKKCAVEVGSFSKLAGFTNFRCGWTIIPKELKREGQKLNDLWTRRQCTFFNGVPYFVQKGAEFVLTQKGQKICQNNIKYYKNNAKMLKDTLKKINFDFVETNNSPYVWLKCPPKYSSWQFFDLLLNEFNIVGIPGCAFGKNGEGYFRFSAFANCKDIESVCKKLNKLK